MLLSSLGSITIPRGEKDEKRGTIVQFLFTGIYFWFCWRSRDTGQPFARYVAYTEPLRRWLGPPAHVFLCQPMCSSVQEPRKVSCTCQSGCMSACRSVCMFVYVSSPVSVLCRLYLYILLAVCCMSVRMPVCFHTFVCVLVRMAVCSFNPSGICLSVCLSMSACWHVRLYVRLYVSLLVCLVASLRVELYLSVGLQLFVVSFSCSA